MLVWDAGMEVAVEREGASYRLVVPLDVETVRHIVGSIEDLLKSSSVVVEAGGGYIVVRVPRRFLGARLVRLSLRRYVAGDTVLVVGRSGVESLVLALDFVDAAEGCHIVVSGAGSGGVARVADAIVRDVASAIAERLRAASPRVELSGEDNRVASLEEPPPVLLSLVYVDSFTPVHNVLLEAVERLLAVMGFGDYLVELSDYRGEYRARLVVRGNRVTGVYAVVRGRELRGEEAVEAASRPPGHRVRIMAWSFRGETTLAVYSPEPVAESDGVTVYRVGGFSSIAYGLVSNSYMLVSRGKAVIVDPSGDPGLLLRAVRSITGELEAVSYIALTSAEPETGVVLRAIVDKLSGVRVATAPHDAAFLTAIVPGDYVKPVPPRKQLLSLDGVELQVIPSWSRGPPTLTFYEGETGSLFTGPLLSAVTPPGFWSLYAENLEAYIEAVESYVRYLNRREDFQAWLEEVSTLTVEVLAPKYGPILKGKQNVEELLGRLARW